MNMRRIFAFAALVLGLAVGASPARAANYLIVCSPGWCAGSDGLMAPPGSALARVTGVASAPTGLPAGEVAIVDDGRPLYLSSAHPAFTVPALTTYDSTVAGTTTIGPAGGNQLTLSGNASASGAATIGLSGTGGIYIAAPDTNSNTVLNSTTLPAGFTGTESIFLGGNAGSKLTGPSNFDLALGTSACGGGATVAFTASSITCVGTDAGRDLAGNGNNDLTLIGTGALYTESLGISSVAAIGTHTFYNENVGQEPADLTGLGAYACTGASGATFTYGTCIGASIGSQLTGASHFLLISGGGNVANTSYASGVNVILIGSGGVAVDTPAPNTSNYINIENILTVTGTNTPSTSILTVAGQLVLPSPGSGTASTYACFTSGHQLISSATAC